MGRFHYWLGTSQVTKFRLVLHRPPFNIFFDRHMAIIFYVMFSSKIIAYRKGTVKYLILSGLYYKQDFCTGIFSTFGLFYGFLIDFNDGFNYGNH
jgi:hypothetical protein